jgi:hypothetical protein
MPKPGMIKYEDAVNEAKAIVSTTVQNCMRLGEIVTDLESKYGERTIERFAKDIGMAHKTLLNIRTTYKVWKDTPTKQLPRSFEVMKALAAQPDRKQIIEKQPNITLKKAREKVRSRKMNFPVDGKIANKPLKRKLVDKRIYVYNEKGKRVVKTVGMWDGRELLLGDPKGQDWRTAVYNLLDIIIGAESSWNRDFPDWKDFAVTSDMVTRVKRAVKVCSKMAKHIERKYPR